MKPLFFAAASVIALGLAACTPNPKPMARVALDCPERQGELTRTGIAADRKTCTYRTREGSEVTLQLVATNGDPKGALNALETSLMGSASQEAKTAEGAAADAKAEAKEAKAEVAQVSADAKSAADAAQRAAKEAEADAAKAAKSTHGPADWKTDRADNGDVEVNLPGLRVQAHDDGAGGNDTAKVDLPGIHINADDETGQAKIQVGGVNIDANGDGAVIRVFREVRLRGEAFARQKRGIRATFIYTGKNTPAGTHFVGYEAGGPKAGPLTVATVRSSADREDIHDSAYDDIKRLVRKNGGV